MADGSPKRLCMSHSSFNEAYFLGEGTGHFRSIPSNCTEAHVPTPRYGQYLTHAHNHITPAVAAMDSCFALVGAHQHGIAVGSMRGGFKDPLLPRRVQALL